MAASQTATGPSHARPRRRRSRRWIGWTVLGLVLLVVVSGVILVKEAFTARDALNQAMDELPATEEALRSGDPDAAQAALDRLQPLTHTARTNTDGPLWWVAGYVPVVGRNAEAVSVASRAVDDIATSVLPSLADVAGLAGGQALTVQNGAVDLSALQEAAPGLSEAAHAMDRIDEDLAGVDASGLIEQISGPLDRLTARTGELGSTVRTADRLATLGPALLGADGPRTYLVVAMNNAELRAGGGIPGAFAVVRTDRGKITLDEQASASDVPQLDAPVADLDAGEEELYSTRLGMFVQDTTLTPDFPTAAALTATMWEQARGQKLDGVFATDPVALSYLLEATGPVTVGPRTLDSANVVEQLLSTSYAELSEDQTDLFFSAVAAQVVAAVLAGDFDPATAVDALDRAASEHRLLLWSAHPEEQEHLADTVVSGAINDAPRAAGSVGVFFNDATGGKMGYYFGSDVRLTNSLCTDAGRVDSFEVDLSSTAPADAATSLPWYVTGGGISGVAPGLIRTQVVLYPSRGGTVSEVQLDDAPLAARTANIADRGVLALPVELASGQSSTLRFSVTTTHPDGADLDVWSTPTTSSPGLRTVPVATCG